MGAKFKPTLCGLELHGYNLSNMYMLIAWFQSLDPLFIKMH